MVAISTAIELTDLHRGAMLQFSRLQQPVWVDSRAAAMPPFGLYSRLDRNGVRWHEIIRPCRRAVERVSRDFHRQFVRQIRDAQPLENQT